MGTELKAMHDLLLKEKPAGAVHEPCALCVPSASADPEGGNVSTLTQEQADALVSKAVADATAPLQARLAELEAGQQTAEIEARITEARAELEAQVADLTTKLDEAEIRATAAEQARADLEQFWAEAIADAEKTSAAAARRDDRLAKVTEFGGFTAEYVEANADRFAAMSDEEFDARLEEWKLLKAAKDDGDTAIPAASAMAGAREGAAAGATNKGSMLTELPNLRRSLADPRTL